MGDLKRRPAGPARRALSGVLAVALGAAALALPAQAADPNALWRIVHDLCVPDFKTTGKPAPCTKIDLGGRYAILKDIEGKTQLLLIPTDKVTGIEDRKVLARGAPNYFAEAWSARPLLEARAGRPIPRDDVGLAINSIDGRSQNQLHIHIDCLRTDVRDALAAHRGAIAPTWRRFPVALAGERYEARRVLGDRLGARNPFDLLARGLPGARRRMGRETLAVIPMTFSGGRKGFVLLADHAELAHFDVGSAEQLLDHDCAVLHPPA
ncbi:MAG: CDP-diacylglycerol diphosphatase [Caulobacteraceae bacterium]